MAHEFDTKILGGLPVTIKFTTGYEDGECGYPGEYVEEWWITAINGRPLRKGDKCAWLYKRIGAAREDDAIECACLNYANDTQYDD